jgi:hypothetical protein
MMIVIEEYKRRGQFDAYLEDGRWLCRSTAPLLDASRKLLAEGLPPETPIAMRHKNSTTTSLRSTIGAAAKLRVGVSGTGRSVFKLIENRSSELQDEEILVEEAPTPSITQP